MEFCRGPVAPIVDLCPASEPESPPLRAIEQSLAQLSFSLTEGDSLETGAIIAAHDQANVVFYQQGQP